VAERPALEGAANPDASADFDTMVVEIGSERPFDDPGVDLDDGLAILNLLRHYRVRITNEAR
jgi:hypothetical protein